MTKDLERLRKVEWTITRDPQSGMFIGVSEQLNLNALGETVQELQERGTRLSSCFTSTCWRTVSSTTPWPSSVDTSRSPGQRETDGLREP